MVSYPVRSVPKYVTNPSVLLSNLLGPASDFLTQGPVKLHDYQMAVIFFKSYLGQAYFGGKVYFDKKFGYQWVSRSGNIVVDIKGRKHYV